jgi:hypothetical protein
MKLGFDATDWEAAKAEGRQVLIECARHRQMIPYSEFATHVRSIQQPGPGFFELAKRLGRDTSKSCASLALREPRFGAWSVTAGSRNAAALRRGRLGCGARCSSGFGYGSEEIQ